MLSLPKNITDAIVTRSNQLQATGMPTQTVRERFCMKHAQNAPLVRGKPFLTDWFGTQLCGIGFVYKC